MKNWKRLVCILCLCAMMLTLCACAEEGEQNNGEVELRVWCVNPIVPNYEETLEQQPEHPQALYTKWLVESFEAANPGVTVKLEYGGWETELNKNLASAIAAGTQPDVTCGGSYHPLYVRYGHFAELDLGEYEGNIVSNTDNISFFRDTRYSVPIFTSTLGLVINQGVLRKAGILDENNQVVEQWKEYNPLQPETWEDLLYICQYIKDYFSKSSNPDDHYIGGILMDDVAGSSHVRALAIMRTAGGEIADDYGNFYLNSEANEKAFSMMRELGKTAPKGSYSVTTEGALFDLFYKGLAAYTVEGIDVPLTISTGAYPDTKAEDLLVVSLPTFAENGVKSNVVCGSMHMSVLKKSKNQEMGQKFIQYILSDESQMKLFEMCYRSPARQDLYAVLEEENSQTYQLLKAYCDMLSGEEYVFEGTIPCFENNPSKIWELWHSFMDRVYVSDTPIAELMKDYEAQMISAFNS